MRAWSRVLCVTLLAVALSSCSPEPPVVPEHVDFDTLPEYAEDEDRKYARYPEGKIRVESDAYDPKTFRPRNVMHRFMACDIQDNAQLAVDLCREAARSECSIHALGDRDVRGLTKGQLVSAIAAYQKRVQESEKLPKPARTLGVEFATLAIRKTENEPRISGARISLEQVAPCRGVFGARIAEHGICVFTWENEDLRRKGRLARSILKTTAECDDGTAFEGLLVMEGPRNGFGRLTSQNGYRLYLLTDMGPFLQDPPVEFADAWKAKRSETVKLVDKNELPTSIDLRPSERGKNK